MTERDITKLTEKYTPKEITTAVKVLVDILAMHGKDRIESIDPKEEFTPIQIKRLQKQLATHSKTEHLSINDVRDALGV